MTEEPKTEEPKIDTLEQELKEYKDKYLRALAESENARKRMQKEKQEAVRYSVDSALAEMLGPLDNLENALNFAQKMSEDVRHWATGFQMIVTQFKDILHNNGVTAFQSEGMTFDPHQHEAVETEETDQHPEGTILQEYVRGYKSADRTIRPARVKVAKAPREEEIRDEKNEQNKESSV